MIKEVTYSHLGHIWYHSKPSDVPYSPNQFLGWNLFSVLYCQSALTFHLKGSSLKSALKLNICKQITKSHNLPELIINFQLAILKKKSHKLSDTNGIRPGLRCISEKTR